MKKKAEQIGVMENPIGISMGISETEYMVRLKSGDYQILTAEMKGFEDIYSLINNKPNLSNEFLKSFLDIWGNPINTDITISKK